jgi:hypothetical protein
MVRSKPDIITRMSTDIISIIGILYKVIISELPKLNFARVIYHFPPKSISYPAIIFKI